MRLWYSLYHHCNSYIRLKKSVLHVETLVCKTSIPNFSESPLGALKKAEQVKRGHRKRYQRKKHALFCIPSIWPLRQWCKTSSVNPSSIHFKNHMCKKRYTILPFLTSTKNQWNGFCNFKMWATNWWRRRNH